MACLEGPFFRDDDQQWPGFNLTWLPDSALARSVPPRLVSETRKLDLQQTGIPRGVRRGPSRRDHDLRLISPGVDLFRSPLSRSKRRRYGQPQSRRRAGERDPSSTRVPTRTGFELARRKGRPPGDDPIPPGRPRVRGTGLRWPARTLWRAKDRDRPIGPRIGPTSRTVCLLDEPEGSCAQLGSHTRTATLLAHLLRLRSADIRARWDVAGGVRRHTSRTRRAYHGVAVRDARGGRRPASRFPPVSGSRIRRRPDLKHCQPGQGSARSCSPRLSYQVLSWSLGLPDWTVLAMRMAGVRSIERVLSVVSSG